MFYSEMANVGVVTRYIVRRVAVVYSILILWTTQSCSHWLKTYSNRFLFKVITLRVTPCVYLLHSPLEKDTIGTFTRFFHQFTSPLEQDQTLSSPWRTYCIIVACSPWSMHCIKLWCSPWNIYSPRSNTNLCWNSVLHHWHFVWCSPWNPIIYEP